jgi:hypothetical protein
MYVCDGIIAFKKLREFLSLTTMWTELEGLFWVKQVLRTHWAIELCPPGTSLLGR